MKKIFSLLFLVVIFAFGGCEKTDNNEVIPSIPSVEIETDDNENERKKYYAVSTVNGLRLRKSPSTTATTVGYLDKNDAVIYIEKQGDFVKTKYKNGYAYVHESYLNLMEIESADEKIENAIMEGCNLLGFPYVWGSQRYHWGNGKLNSNFVYGEFDCSAFVQYVYYMSNDIILDVTSRAQAYNGKEIPKNELKRGDLMFFTNASRKNKVGNERIGHVGIYFGNNYILHTASDHAVLEPISSTRWSYYITARRVL